MGGNDLEATLPRHCYLDAVFFERERRRIFAREWFCVARAPELERIGDYRVVNLCGQSVIVARISEEAYGAYHNLCRHRGSQLVPAPDREPLAGRFKGGIRCPYHSWFYGLDGSLKRTPHLDIDRRNLGLYPVALESWGGFLFARLAGDGPSLTDSLGEIAARIKRYPLADLRVGRTIQYSVKANWKAVLENYNECYHCAGVHPELCRIVPAFRDNGGAGLDWNQGIPHREGANTFTISGTTNRAPFPGLDEHERTRHKGELIYPNLMLSLAMDHACAFLLWPRAADRTDITCQFLFHPGQMSKQDFDPSDAVDFWDVTNRQDWAVCENVQRGMGSEKFEHGYYAPMEDMSLDIRDYVRARIPNVWEMP